MTPEYECQLQGWVSGPQYSGPALSVQITVDDIEVTTVTANVSRNISGNHGFVAQFPCNWTAAGFHQVHARASGLNTGLGTLSYATHMLLVRKPYLRLRSNSFFNY